MSIEKLSALKLHTFSNTFFVVVVVGEERRGGGR